MVPMKKEALQNERYEANRHSISAFRANVAGLFLPVPLALLYIVLYRASYPYLRHLGNIELPLRTEILIPVVLIAFFASIILLNLLHEMIHAAVFRIWGKGGPESVVFRLSKMSFYAHGIEAIPLGVYRFALIAPLLLQVIPLAFLSVFLGDPFSFLITLIMIFSTGGDLFTLWITRKYSGKGIYVTDDPDLSACEIFVPR
jgi:hypothetical protein